MRNVQDGQRGTRQGLSLQKDRIETIKGKAVASHVAVQVLGLEVLDQGDGGEAKPAYVITACGDKFCRAGERGKPSGWRCSKESAGFSCLCGHGKGDTIEMVQKRLGLPFFKALEQLDHALPTRSVRTDRAASGDLFGAPAPCEAAMRPERVRS